MYFLMLTSLSAQQNICVLCEYQNTTQRVSCDFTASRIFFYPWGLKSKISMDSVAGTFLVPTLRHHIFICLVLWRTTCEKTFIGRWRTAECWVRATAQVRTNLMCENTRYFLKVYESSWISIFNIFSSNYAVIHFTAQVWEIVIFISYK